METDRLALIESHQRALDAAASDRTRAWWERYMKGVIPFRGVGIPRNRELLEQWRDANGIGAWSPEDQLEIALAFFDQPYAEDKLAGVLYLQNYLLDRLPWRTLLNRYVALYDQRLIFDWNVCDWFCVRVLGPTISRNGVACADALVAWKDAEYLWKARSSVVPFVKLASHSEYYPLLERSAATLIRRDERFAKTAVGWVLLEVSRHDRRFVRSVLDANLEHFSKESLSNALKRFGERERKTYQRRLALS